MFLCFKKKLFIYVFLAALGLCCYLWVFSSCSTWASHCGGFSCCRAWAPGCEGLSSDGSWAQLLCSTWDLSGPGIELMSHVLAGGFLTTRLPGKSCSFAFKCLRKIYSLVRRGCHNKIPQSGLNSRNLFFTVLEAGSLRSGCCLIWFRMRALFLASDGHGLAVSSCGLSSGCKMREKEISFFLFL